MALTADEIDKLKVAELKEKLEAAGESTKGNKGELAERLKQTLIGAAPSAAAAAKPPLTLKEQHDFLDLAKAFDFAKVRALINERADYVNVQPVGRWTAIHQAALHGDKDMIEFLISKGADLKCKNRDGHTPLDVAKPDCKHLLAPPTGKAKSKAPPGGSAAAPPAKSQKVSMKGGVVQAKSSHKSSGSDVKMVVKGRAAVDTGFDLAPEFHVYESGDDVYDALLNQTDIKDNKNKYYIIQLLETDKAPHQYYTHNRWGRVGESHSQKAQRGPMSLHEALADFQKKFKDKTANDWANRASFVAKNGKYTLLARDYGNDDEGDDDGGGAAAPAAAAGGAGSSGEPKPAAQSQLDPRVQKFVSLIADVRMMEEQMREIGFDAKKMPLGKLKKETVLQAYAVLQQLAAVVSPAGGSGKAAGAAEQVEALSNQFYSLIPHATKKMTDRLPYLQTAEQVRAKTEMVEALGEIQLASKVLGAKPDAPDVHPIDASYARLRTKLTPLDVGGKEHGLLAAYLANTHAATHAAYSLELVQAFEIEREGEAPAFRDLGNRQLLWHGSRLTNWCGILSQGLRIAPPEAPVTGYMFGKGVYFADMSSKSANYCFATKASPTGVLLLSEVALGGAYERLAAQYDADAACRKAGKQHTWGKGRTAPDPAGGAPLRRATAREADGGLHVPMGTSKPSGVDGTSLLYNEFIVYDTAQIKQRYVLQVKFHYSH